MLDRGEQQLTGDQAANRALMAHEGARALADEIFVSLFGKRCHRSRLWIRLSILIV